jgi:hypothetical protein
VPEEIKYFSEGFGSKKAKREGHLSAKENITLKEMIEKRAKERG